MYDIEIVLQIVETALNSNEFLSDMADENYYGAGYSIGASGLGLIFLLEDIKVKYDEAQPEDGATDVSEEEGNEDSGEYCSFDC
jgi:hypothetical protein